MGSSARADISAQERRPDSKPIRTSVEPSVDVHSHHAQLQHHQYPRLDIRFTIPVPDRKNISTYYLLRAIYRQEGAFRPFTTSTSPLPAPERIPA